MQAAESSKRIHILTVRMIPIGARANCCLRVRWRRAIIIGITILIIMIVVIEIIDATWDEREKEQRKRTKEGMKVRRLVAICFSGNGDGNCSGSGSGIGSSRKVSTVAVWLLMLAEVGWLNVSNSVMIHVSTIKYILGSNLLLLLFTFCWSLCQSAFFQVKLMLHCSGVAYATSAAAAVAVATAAGTRKRAHTKGFTSKGERGRDRKRAREGEKIFAEFDEHPSSFTSIDVFTF